MTSSIMPDWTLSTVGEQFDVQLGKMLDAARNIGVPKPYVGNRAVQWERIDVSAVGSVPMTPSDMQRYRLRRGDLLVCEGGEVGRAAIWRDELPECYFQKALHRLRAKSNYDVRLMMAFLEYWASLGGFSNYVTQTSIAHLPRAKFVQMPLPVPDKWEQEQLSDLLDDAHGEIATLERLIAKKQAIKQGMMQQLFTGRTRLPGFTMPWTWQPFSDIMSRLNAKKHQIPASSYSDAGRLPVIDQGQKAIVGYTNDVAAEFDPGSDGVVVFGDHTCITKFVDFKFAVGADGTQIVKAKKGNSTRFFSYALEADPVMSTGYNRHFKFLREKVLPVPAFDEQIAIVNVLRDTDDEIAATGTRLAKARDIKTGMMHQLLTGRTRLLVQEVAA